MTSDIGDTARLEFEYVDSVSARSGLRSSDASDYVRNHGDPLLYRRPIESRCTAVVACASISRDCLDEAEGEVEQES